MPPEKSTALITGASAGIGRELAKQFASHGHDLILVARNRDALEALAGTLEGKHGIKATVIACDLSDPDSPQRLFDSTVSEGLDVDILVNNAGFGFAGEFADTDIDRELDMIQVNIAAVTHMTKLFMQPMLKRNKGRILNIASTAGFQPGPGMSVYFASKAYVLSLSQAIDEELRNTGVTVPAYALEPRTPNLRSVQGSPIHDSSSFPVLLRRKRLRDLVMKPPCVAIALQFPVSRTRRTFRCSRLVPRSIVTLLARKAHEAH